MSSSAMSAASTVRYQVGTPWRRGAMRKTSSTAQPGKGMGGLDGDFSGANHGLVASTEWAARPRANLSYSPTDGDASM
jgi:hypothetical protein